MLSAIKAISNMFKCVSPSTSTEARGKIQSEINVYKNSYTTIKLKQTIF